MEMLRSPHQAMGRWLPLPVDQSYWKVGPTIPPKIRGNRTSIATARLTQLRRLRPNAAAAAAATGVAVAGAVAVVEGAAAAEVVAVAEVVADAAARVAAAVVVEDTKPS